MDPEAPFQPVRNGEVVLFSINIRRTCEAFGIPLDDNLQKEFQSFSLKTYAAVVDKVRNKPVRMILLIPTNMLLLGCILSAEPVVHLRPRAALTRLT